jgi:hypothetical protein
MLHGVMVAAQRTLHVSLIRLSSSFRWRWRCWWRRRALIEWKVVRKQEMHFFSNRNTVHSSRDKVIRSDCGDVISKLESSLLYPRACYTVCAVVYFSFVWRSGCYSSSWTDKCSVFRFKFSRMNGNANHKISFHDLPTVMNGQRYLNSRNLEGKTFSAFEIRWCG